MSTYWDMSTYGTSWRKGNLLKRYTETTGSSTLVKEITSRRFPDYNEFTWEDMDYGKVYHGGHFIHNTQASNLESILREGLDMGSDSIDYRSNGFLWCVNPEIESRNRKEPIKDIWTGYGGTSIIFHVPEGIYVDQLNADQYGVWGAIPPEYIDSIDTPIYWDEWGETYRLSDLKELALDGTNSHLGDTPGERLDVITRILGRKKFQKFSDDDNDMELLIEFVRENLR